VHQLSDLQNHPNSHHHGSGNDDHIYEDKVENDVNFRDDSSDIRHQHPHRHLQFSLHLSWRLAKYIVTKDGKLDKGATSTSNN
jgi:hypothetical protein